MVITHSNSTQEKWQTENLYKFQKNKYSHKEGSIPITFHNEMLNTVVGYEAYSFLDGYLGYHQISIALEDKYNIAFVIDWGVFIWKASTFGVKNGPPTYQKAITKTFYEYLNNFMKIFLDDFTVYSDMESHLHKLKLCFKSA
jgi:hypothetical protein